MTRKSAKVKSTRPLGRMNYASLKNSKRLKLVDKYLADRVPHSTRDIIRATGMCAINSIISELRANGRTINCHQDKRVFYYRRVW